MSGDSVPTKLFPRNPLKELDEIENDNESVNYLMHKLAENKKFTGSEYSQIL